MTLQTDISDKPKSRRAILPGEDSLWLAVVKRFRSMLMLSAIFMILLVIFITILYRQNEVSRERDDQVIQSYEILRTGRVILTQLLNMETGQRGYLLSGSKQFLIPYEEGHRKLDEGFEKLAIMVQMEDAELLEKYSQLRPKAGAVMQLLAEHMRRYDEMRAKAKGVKPLSLADMWATKEAMDDFRATMDDFLRTENVNLNLKMARSRQQQENYSIIMLGGAVGLFAVFLLANFLLLANRARALKFKNELQHVEETYRLLMENMSDGIYDFDPVTGVMQFSPSHEKLLGYRPAEMPSRIETINNLIHPDDFAATWEVVNKYMRRELPSYSAMFRLLHKNGEWRWILSRGVGVWDEEGNIRRMVGIHTDITPQKQREEQLALLNAELESFTYIASHDLRGPLINIKGFAGEVAYMLGEVTPKLAGSIAALPDAEKQSVGEIFDKEIPEALGFIQSAVDKMDKLTSAILDLSRIGRREYLIQEIDSEQVVRECINGLAYEIAKKNIDVVYHNLPRLQTDEVALTQIIGNILDNAVKYMDAKPNGEKGKIVINAELVPGAYQFSIKDNGVGISETDSKKIFDIFRRGANARGTRGLGMGMTYIKTTLRRLGGQVWFDSKVGEGTTFFFTLPFDFDREVA